MQSVSALRLSLSVDIHCLLSPFQILCVLISYYYLSLLTFLAQKCVQNHQISVKNQREILRFIQEIQISGSLVYCSLAQSREEAGLERPDHSWLDLLSFVDEEEVPIPRFSDFSNHVSADSAPNTYGAHKSLFGVLLDQVDYRLWIEHSSVCQ